MPDKAITRPIDRSRSKARVIARARFTARAIARGRLGLLLDLGKT